MEKKKKMNYIGSVIKKQRDTLKMTRKELASGICSEKYIYLIERGRRTPAADITRLLGDRLGVDLFKHYEYLDCENPIEVEKFMRSFDRYRAENNMLALKKITDKAAKLPDFNKAPWVYEIKLNEITYRVLKEKKHKREIKKIQDMIKNIESKHSKSICVANLYILLSTCYLMAGELNHAKEATLTAYEIVIDKQKIEKYEQIVTTVKINKITVFYLLGELDDVIEDGMKLLQYQIRMAKYERIHHTFFYLAYAYYQKGNEDEGLMYFEKALHVSLIKYKPMDFFFLSAHEIFTVLINEPRISSELAEKFKKEYDKK